MRLEVLDAIDLAAKLKIAHCLASNDPRRPHWLKAIAIRTADRGLEALSGWFRYSHSGGAPPSFTMV